MSENARWIIQGAFGRVTINTTDQPIVEHAHPELNLFFKLSGADATMQVDGEMPEISDRRFVMVNAWQSHAKPATDAGQATIMAVLIDPAWLAGRLGLAQADRPFARSSAELSPVLGALVQDLAEFIMTQSLAHPRLFEARLAALLQVVIAQFGTDAPLSERARPIDYRIRKALAYISENAETCLRVEDVARAVGLSRSRFFEQFRLCVGISPRHYLNCLRLRIATEWLTRNDAPLCELSEQLGYSGHSNFTRFFTQHLALPPSVFRRQTITIAAEAEGLTARAAA